MLNRIERDGAPLGRAVPARRKRRFATVPTQPAAELALSYSNGFVTVEISQDALDAYIAHTGDVPLPVVTDPQTGDRRTYDAYNRVRVVYDEASHVREVATRSKDGMFVRINFPRSLTAAA